RHEAIDGETETAADGAEPGVSHLAGGEAASGAAAQVAPVKIAFQAIDHLADLPVITERAADQSARGVGIAGERRAEVRTRPGAAGVDADIRPGPVVSRGDIGRRLGDDLAARQV